ncbi:MAG: hypothetical protein M3320_03610 [Actinomycetota bacterium]|nr:hypothetical protein [Actinomycetota bacterium]MDQ5807743.1 hypothetical protein [Actinomycetota bacterium]
MPQDPITYAKRLERGDSRSHDGRLRVQGRLRGEPYDWSHSARSPHQAASRANGRSERTAGLLLSVVAAVVLSTGALYQFALAVAWLASLEAGYAVAFIAAVGALPFARKRCREMVRGRGVLVGAALGFMFLSGAVLAATSGTERRSSPPPRPTVDTRSQPMFAMPDLALPAAPGAHGFVRVGDELWQWGGRRITGPQDRPRITVPGAITDVQPCGGGILVAFGSGGAARYSVRTGRRLGPAVDVAAEPLTIACGAGSVFLGLGEQGVVMRVTLIDLTVEQGWILIPGHVGGLLVSSEFTLVVGDLSNGRVAHVSLQRNEVDHYTTGIPEAQDFISRREGGAFALAPNGGCVRPVSWDSSHEASRGTSVPGRVAAVTSDRESLLLLVQGGYWIQRIDLETMRAGPLVDVPGDHPASDIAVVEGGLLLLQPEAGRRSFVTARRFRELEQVGRREGLTLGGPCV